MHPVLFKIGSLTFYTYGFMVFTGIVSGFLFCRFLAGKDGIKKEFFDNLFFWSLVWGFIGARLLYVITQWQVFLISPWTVLFNRSGFVFYGGLIAATVAIYFMSRKKKVDFFKIADIFVVGLPLAHSFGRLGCFFYGCCYGVPVSSSIGMLFPPDSPAGALGVKVIPTQLISAAGLFLIFLILLISRKSKKFNGQLLTTYMFLYSIFRFSIEFFRGDPRGSIFNIPTSQLISVFMFVAAIVLLSVLPKRKR